MILESASTEFLSGPQGRHKPGPALNLCRPYGPANGCVSRLPGPHAPGRGCVGPAALQSNKIDATWTAAYLNL